MPEKTYLQAISDGLRQEMRRDKRVFIIGEDVGVYGDRDVAHPLDPLVLEWEAKKGAR